MNRSGWKNEHFIVKKVLGNKLLLDGYLALLVGYCCAVRVMHVSCGDSVCCVSARSLKGREGEEEKRGRGLAHLIILITALVVVEEDDRICE